MRVTHRNLLIALITLLILGGAFAFMIYKISAQGVVLEEYIKILEEQNTQEASLLRLQKIAEDTKNDRTQLQGHFLKQESESLTFLNLVEGLAPQMNVTLETTDLNKIENKTDKSEWIEVHFDLTGSKEDIVRFVRTLEVLPYVSRVNSVLLTVRSLELWQAEVVMQVRIMSYES